MAPDSGLGLRAEDEADLAVISACLQDALVVVRDLSYDRAARQFSLIANRFRWEGGGPGFERTLCAVAFGEIDGVAYRGFRRGEEERILSLLAIRRQQDGKAPAIVLDFSGGAAIRLAAAAISCRARDIGEPWPTAWLPSHPADEPA